MVRGTAGAEPCQPTLSTLRDGNVAAWVSTQDIMMSQHTCSTARGTGVGSPDRHPRLLAVPGVPKPIKGRWERGAESGSSQLLSSDKHPAVPPPPVGPCVLNFRAPWMHLGTP